MALQLNPVIIGYDLDGQPIWRAAGARGGFDFTVDDKDGDEPDDFDEEDDADDEDDDEPDDEEEADDEEDGTAARRPRQRQQKQEPDDEWEPPSKEQFEKIERALARNNGENRKLRHTRKIMQKIGVTDEQQFVDWMLDRGFDPETGQPIPGGANAADDILRGENGAKEGDGDDTAGGARTQAQIITERRRAEERGSARAEAKFKPAIVSFAAAAALQEAGFTSKNVGMALRLLDTADIDVEFDSNGDPVVYGLDEQVVKLKEDFPELFARKRARDDEDAAPARKRAGGRTVNGARSIDGGDRGKPRAKVQGWEQKLLQQMTGGRR